MNVLSRRIGSVVAAAAVAFGLAAVVAPAASARASGSGGGGGAGGGDHHSDLVAAVVQAGPRRGGAGAGRKAFAAVTGTTASGTAGRSAREWRHQWRDDRYCAFSRFRARFFETVRRGGADGPPANPPKADVAVPES